MKCSAKPWAEHWAESRTVEKRSVLVSGTFVFRTGLYLKCSGAAYGLSKKLHAEFCVIFTKVGISGLSLDFSEAKYGRNYGRKFQIYVKCFCVLLLEI